MARMLLKLTPRHRYQIDVIRLNMPDPEGFKTSPQVPSTMHDLSGLELIIVNVR
jgi:hypothetical protein